MKNAEDAFAQVTGGTRWLSVEPLLTPLMFTRLDLFQWVVIGGASASTQTPAWVPPIDWIRTCTSRPAAPAAGSTTRTTAGCRTACGSGVPWYRAGAERAAGRLQVPRGDRSSAIALRGALTHRKTRRLARLLDIEIPCALGVMEALWHVTATHAPTGSIGRLSDQDIADEMFWTSGKRRGSCGRWSKRNCSTKTRRSRLVVHDWPDHADDAIQVKLARHGQRFANGVLPSMRRLQKSEREEILRTFARDAQNSTNSHLCAQKPTAAHKSAPGVCAPS